MMSVVRLVARWTASLLIALCGARAIGQALPTAAGPGASVMAGGGLSLFQAVYGQRDLGGGFVFAEFSPHWRFNMEAEARYLRVHSAEEVTERNFLVGPRALVTSGRERVYVKFLVGDGHISMPFQYGRGDFLALVPGGGVELDLNDMTTLRVVDFEYQMWRGFPFGTMQPYGISTGISFRLSPIVRFPKGDRFRRDGRRASKVPTDGY
jgi:hypothetical protein